MSLAVLDWGIGGVPTWDALRRRSPNLDLVYFSDSGYAPYGTVEADVLSARITTIAHALSSAHDVTHVVVACNAASAALDVAGHEASVRITGIIDEGVSVALSTKARRIGVIGGEGTIRAGLHERRLRAAGREVVARVAQPLSAHVEAGRLRGEDVERSVDDVLAPLRDVDAVLLACTHYIALMPLFEKALPSMLFVDPGAALVERVLGETPDRGGATSKAFTTGDSQATRSSAEQAFGADLGEVREFAI